MDEKGIERVVIDIDKVGKTTITYQSNEGIQETRLVSLKDVMRTINQYATHTLFLSGEIVATDMAETIVWWRPPQIQSIIINDAERKQSVYQLPMPGLLLRMKLPKRIDLVAIKGKKRPERTTPVFHAPLPNISGRGGTVCLGATQLTRQGDSILSTNPRQVWQEFWNSAFNNHSAADRCKKYPKDVRLLLFELQGEKRFPSRELLPTGITVEGWLRS